LAINEHDFASVELFFTIGAVRIIDNYDLTFNLARYFEELGAQVKVVKMMSYILESVRV
jgi:hypothetical protein